MHRLKLAFSSAYSPNWIAGLHYQNNLFSALKLLDSDQQPLIFMLAGSDEYQEQVRFLNNLEVEAIIWPEQDHSFKQRWTARALQIQRRTGIWLGPQPSLRSSLKEKGIDCIFSNTQYGPRFSIPLLTWIPDFQHIHLPEMFPPEQVQRRNTTYLRAATYADRIILSSRSTLDDLEMFDPDLSQKARVISFVANVPDETFRGEPGVVLDLYNLPECFFYLPNQFWRHKNHKVVLDALGILCDEGLKPVVVCSGATHDYRQPSYFPELLAYISQNNLRDNVILLGMIPHSHVLQLIRQALAVLQPSLFEGWSTTVEETKSIGKSIILSNIPVHNEQDPPKCFYFDPYSAASLAGQMRSFLNDAHSGPDKELERKAQEHLRERQLTFAQSFLNVVQELVG